MKCRAEIEVVIKIPEEEYNIIKNYTAPMIFAEHLIKNGKVLPKGHGRLIDTDALYDQYEYADYDFEEALEYAPTVIEADRERINEI